MLSCGSEVSAYTIPMTLGMTLFALGVFGTVSLVVLRTVEVGRGKRFADPARSYLDRVASRLYRLLVFGEIPTTYRSWALEQFRALTHRSVVFLVGFLRAVERPLSRLNHRLRASRQATQSSRDPSPFLKDIAPEKPSNQNGAPPTNQV